MCFRVESSALFEFCAPPPSPQDWPHLSAHLLAALCMDSMLLDFPLRWSLLSCVQGLGPLSRSGGVLGTTGLVGALRKGALRL